MKNFNAANLNPDGSGRIDYPQSLPIKENVAAIATEINRLRAYLDGCLS